MPWLEVTTRIAAQEAEGLSEALLEAGALSVTIDDPDAANPRISALLGAGSVDAVDIDPQALEATAANARDNGVDLRFALPEELDTAFYDVIVSNILAQPLIVLAPLFAARARQGMRLALAGVLETQ